MNWQWWHLNTAGMSEEKARHHHGQGVGKEQLSELTGLFFPGGVSWRDFFKHSVLTEA